MSKKGKGKGDKSAQDGGDGLTGVFSNDFPLHCVQNGLPPISVKPLSRSGAPPSGDTPSPATGDHAPSSPHSVLVEPDPGTSHSLRTIHLRNLLLDQRVMAALSSALEGTQLAAMILWNVGLSDDICHKLLPLVTSCGIRRLALDGNQVPTHQVISILESTSVELLSLKCCCLGDAFCTAISSALAANRSLTALDLSSNQITDQGVAQLAHALRLNRTLLSLCLAGNRIGDCGVEAICKVLVKFPLTKEEEQTRKSLLATSDSGGVDMSGGSPSLVSLDKSGRGSRGGGRGKKEQRKEEKEKSGRVSAAGKGGKGSKAGGKKGSGVRVEEREEPPQVAGGAGKSREPLLDLVREEGGRLWMRGNSTLAHLTLSCNRVGVRGVASLLEMLRSQQGSTPSPVTSDPSAADKMEPHGTGLVRVTLEHNTVPMNCPELIEMMSLLQSRDPLATPTSPQ